MLAASPPLNLAMAEEPTGQMHDIMIDNDFFLYFCFVCLIFSVLIVSLRTELS